MKRREAFPGGSTHKGTPPTAAQLNEEVFQWALDHVPPQAREKYEKYGEKGW